MATDLHVGGRTFALVELTMGDLRRVPALAGAITTLINLHPDPDAPAVPTVEQIESLATLLFASASHAAPDLTRAEFDTAFNTANVAKLFQMAAIAPSLVYGDSPPEVEPSGEAARPSS